MHRLIRGTQIGALALLLVLGAGNVACKKGSSGTSTNVFDASGGDGNSTDGAGGDGNEVNFLIYHGGAGSIELKSSGSVDASFTPTGLFTPELGATPLVGRAAKLLDRSPGVADSADGSWSEIDVRPIARLPCTATRDHRRA